ncbi:MAG: leucine-rich repeat protein [Clostridia bacterium]|nr:leucine-rich repeat protein [Clostridia bacterium]
MKHMYALLLAVLLLIAGQAAFAEEDWAYRLDEDGYAHITAYLGADRESLSVPAQVDGHWVLGLDGGVFAQAPALRTVSIPGSVQLLDDGVFSGRTDLTVQAYNGTSALSFAREKGLKTANRSRLDFTEGVYDLTGIPKDAYSYVTNGVRMPTVFAMHMDVGSLFFLPPDSRNSLGEAYEVRAMKAEGETTVITMAKASPTLALEKLCLDVDDIYLDFSRMQVIDNSLTDIMISSPKFVIDTALPQQTLTATLRNGNLEGTIELTAAMGRFMIDMDMMPFSLNAFEFRMDMTASLELAYTISSPMKSKAWDIAVVPFCSASGLVNGWVKISLEPEITGKIAMKCTVGGSTAVAYSKAGGWSSYYDSHAPSITFSVAAEAGVKLYAPKLSFDVPLVGEVASIGTFFEAKGEAKAAAELMNPTGVNCADITVTLSVGGDAKVGFIDWQKKQQKKLEEMFDRWEAGEDDMALPELKMPYFEFEFAQHLLDKKIYHVENGYVVDECTKEGVTLLFDAGFEKTLASSFCPNGIVDIPDEYWDITRPGYEFMGWYYKPSGADVTEMAGNGDQLTKNPTTVYAYWEPIVKDPFSWKIDVDGTSIMDWGWWFDAAMESDGYFHIYIGGSEGGYVRIPSYAEIREYYQRLVSGGVIIDPSIDIPDNKGFVFHSQYIHYLSATSITWPAGIASTTGAFGSPNLTSVSWPSSMYDIGSYRYCHKLENVTFPAACVTYGSFLGCTGLKYIDMGSCTNLYVVDFHGCPNIETIIMPPNVTTIRNLKGTKNLRTVDIPGILVYIEKEAFMASGLESISFPEAVSIGESAFKDCTSLASLDLPESTELGKSAFYNCTSLASIDFPESEVKIEEATFRNCTSLEEVTLNASYIGEFAFADCTSLKRVNIYFDEMLTIDESAFTNTPLLESVTIIGSGDIYIDEAFGGSGVEHVEIRTSGNVVLICDEWRNLDMLHIEGNELTVICGGNIRYANIEAAGGLVCSFNSSRLEEVDITAPTISLLSGCFNYCSELERLNLSGKVLFSEACFRSSGLREISFEVGGGAIPSGMFSDSANLERVELTGTCMGVMDFAFNYCPNLKEVILPTAESEWTPDIGEYAFIGCDSLERVELGEGFGWIKRQAFEDCYNLTEVILPDTIEIIDAYAFKNCINLEEIKLPKNLTSLGSYAFMGCGLTTLTVPDSLETISDYAFWGCTMLEGVRIGKNVKTIGSGAFMGCESLRVVEFLNGDVDIYGSFNRNPGEGAFRGCSALERIICPKGSAVDKMAEEFGLASGPVGQEFHTLQIMTNSALGTLEIQAKPGQNVYPDKLTWGYPVTISGYYTDATCQTWAGYPYVMPDEDSAIYMHCGMTWPENLHTDGSTVQGSTLTDCSVTGAYYVIDGVTALGPNAIGPGVTHLFIPAGVSAIDPKALESASGLESIMVMDDNPNYQSIGGMLFDRDGTLLHCPRMLEEVHLPAGTTGIAANAFVSDWGSMLSRLHVPEGLVSVEAGAFDSLKQAAIYGPASGVVAEEAAKAGIPYNEYVIWYRTKNEIVGASTCKAGELLTAVKNPSNLWADFNGWSLTENGSLLDLSAFTMPYEDLMLYAVWATTVPETWVEFPEALLTIGAGALEGTSVEAILCHAGIQDIESRAFADCPKLTHVKFLSAQTQLAADTFAACDLENLTILAPENSPAHDFAVQHGISWRPVE